MLACELPSLLEEADFVLRTGFASQPPEIDLDAILSQKLDSQKRRDVCTALFGSEADANSPAAVMPHSVSGSEYPKRAAWLNRSLRDLGWSDADPAAWGGPDRKTIQKILRGKPVTNNVLKKLADALSKPSGAHLVIPSGIPNE